MYKLPFCLTPKELHCDKATIKLTGQDRPADADQSNPVGILNQRKKVTVGKGYCNYCGYLPISCSCKL